MPLTDKSYVPILKWKRAEQTALKELSEAQASNIMPLIEIVPANPGKKGGDPTALFLNERTREIPTEILKSWGEDPIFLDMSLVYPSSLKTEAIGKIITNCVELRLQPVVVFNLSDGQDYINLVLNLEKHTDMGVCLRIGPSELFDVDSLNQRLVHLIQLKNIAPEKIDILVDLKEKVDDQTYVRCALLAQQLTELSRWRSLIFAAGAFPQDLTACRKDEENIISRIEWLGWNRQLNSQKITRKPTFADYTIRHPIYNEATVNFPGTASVKYTLKNDWRIMKGERYQSEQYLAHAATLIPLDEFYGESFSAGDAYIKEKGLFWPEYAKQKASDPDKAKGTGRAEDWIRAGINHHLCVVVDQLANPA